LTDVGWHVALATVGDAATVAPTDGDGDGDGAAVPAHAEAMDAATRVSASRRI
jgi:hypothetical protein